ncbi:MAG: RloB family protein [Bacteroidota bacterium]
MRRAGQHILVLPEGWCEYNYAQALKNSLPREKQRSISVEMPKPNNENSALQLLNKAEKRIKNAKKDNNPYNAVWIFFDNDNQPDLTEFFQKLTNTTVQIAYSCMCIEHWFIIHLEDNRQAFQNAQQALQRIETLWQNNFNQPFHKTKVNHFQKLTQNLATAMNRANTITQQAEADGTPIAKRNPFFTIQDFIHFFQSL